MRELQLLRLLLLKLLGDSCAVAGTAEERLTRREGEKLIVRVRGPSKPVSQ